MRALILILIAVTGFQAAAVANFFIPNYYKNRRTMNDYAALGWSDRHEAVFEYDHSNTSHDTGGVRSANDSADEYEAMGFYRLKNNLNLEADLFRTNADNHPATTTTTNRVTTNFYELGAGYEFTGVPVAIGASYSGRSADTERGTNGNITNTRTYNTSVGGGYKLPSDIYLGAGFLNQHQFNANTDLTYRFYYMGGGIVVGGREFPTAAAEAFLAFGNNNGTQSQAITARGLYNMGPMQAYGVVSYNIDQGLAAGSGYDVRLGVDYEYFRFYIGPEIYYVVSKTDDGTIGDNSNTVPSLEAGYRMHDLEVYLRYGNNRGSSSFDASNLRTDQSENLYTAGAIYKF